MRVLHAPDYLRVLTKPHSGSLYQVNAGDGNFRIRLADGMSLDAATMLLLMMRGTDMHPAATQQSQKGTHQCFNQRPLAADAAGDRISCWIAVEFFCSTKSRMRLLTELYKIPEQKHWGALLPGNSTFCSWLRAQGRWWRLLHPLPGLLGQTA